MGARIYMRAEEAPVRGAWRPHEAIALLVPADACEGLAVGLLRTRVIRIIRAIDCLNI